MAIKLNFNNALLYADTSNGGEIKLGDTVFDNLNEMFVWRNYDNGVCGLWNYGAQGWVYVGPSDGIAPRLFTAYYPTDLNQTYFTFAKRTMDP